MAEIFEKFLPKEYVGGVFDVDYGALYNRGIRSIVFDVDNTLEPFDVAAPSLKVVSLLRGLNERFGLCLLSNNSKNRVEKFNESLNLPALWRSGKPSKKAANAALKMLGNPTPKTVALVGDQLFTDMWLANKAGFYAVLVKPIARRDEFFVKLKRLPEGLIFRIFLRRRAFDG